MVNISSENCAKSDSITIEVKELTCGPPDVFIPNAFSPNNDGQNDFFLPHLECQNVENYEFQIYSRWGDPVFNTNDYSEWWDGKKAGNHLMPTGVYVWFMKFEIRERNYYFDGDVLLMR